MFNFKRKKAHSNILMDSKRLLSDTTPFAINEAYRALYTNILYLPIESKCKKIAVVSALPGECKTTTAINLAYTIAANSPESKVLLIDADLRKPRVASLIGYRGKKMNGLSEFLAGIDEAPAYATTPYSNLTFLSSGAPSYNSPALLSTARMKTLFELIENEFDYVIFDTPPLNVVADALLLNDYVSGYVVSVKYGYSDLNSISDALQRFDNSEGKVFGFVINSYNFKNEKRRSRRRTYGYGGVYSNGYGE